MSPALWGTPHGHGHLATNLFVNLRQTQTPGWTWWKRSPIGNNNTDPHKHTHAHTLSFSQSLQTQDKCCNDFSISCYSSPDTLYLIFLSLFITHINFIALSFMHKYLKMEYIHIESAYTRWRLLDALSWPCDAVVVCFMSSCPLKWLKGLTKCLKFPLTGKYTMVRRGFVMLIFSQGYEYNVYPSLCSSHLKYTSSRLKRSHFLHIYTQAGKMTPMMTFNYRPILF